MVGIKLINNCQFYSQALWGINRVVKNQRVHLSNLGPHSVPHKGMTIGVMKIYNLC